MQVEYIDHMGSDLTVVNAARVSFDKESSWEVGTDGGDDWAEYLKESDEKLIKYLASHNHWTPFGHPTITVRETVPLFVARERFRHTVGFVYNEVSRRYVDTSPQMYHVPVGEWRKCSQDKKQGSGDYIDDHEIQYDCESSLQDVHEICKDTYKWMIEHGVAPEQARMVLPQSMYTSYYCTGSLAAFARAYGLRSSPDAQLEIQEVAKGWDEVIRPLFPVSWEALTS